MPCHCGGNLARNRQAAPASGAYDGGMNDQRITSGSPMEPVIGFSRAVRAGPWIAVSGTAPLGPDGATVGRGDVYAQTRRCLEITLRAIAEAGGTAADVIRTRI